MWVATRIHRGWRQFYRQCLGDEGTTSHRFKRQRLVALALNVLAWGTCFSSENRTFWPIRAGPRGDNKQMLSRRNEIFNCKASILQYEIKCSFYDLPTVNFMLFINITLFTDSNLPQRNLTGFGIFSVTLIVAFLMFRIHILNNDVRWQSQIKIYAFTVASRLCYRLLYLWLPERVW